MFKRSRRKIIVSIMASLILLFIITLTVIMLASYRELRLRDARRSGKSANETRPSGIPSG